MKTSRLFTILCSFVLTSSARAAVQFWDPDGATLGTSVSGNWDTTTASWTATPDSGANATWTQGSDASFGIAADYTVTLTEPITNGSISVSGAAGILTIAGTTANSLNLAGSAILTTGGRNINISAPINGNFDLTRTGAGTVTLSGASTYSAGTTLSAGTTTLAVDSVYSGGIVSGPFGTGPVNVTATLTISPSGARVLDNPITLNAGLTVGGSAAMTFRNGNFVINGGNRTLTINDTADVTIQGNVIDDGVPLRVLTKAGTAGKLILSGNNTAFLGSITINAGGTLAAGSATAVQLSPANAVLTANGTFDLNGFDCKVVGLAGSGAVALGSRTLTIAAAGTSRNFTGVISGSGGLIVSNIISQQIEGQNTFTGGMLIKAGTLFLRTNAAVGDSVTRAAGTGTITLEGTDPVVANVTAALGGNLSTGTVRITNNVVISTNRILLFPSNGGTVQYDGAISGPGGIQRDGNGSGPAVLTGNNTYAGGLHIEGRAVGLGNRNAPGTGEFALGNPITPPSNTILLIPVADLTGANSITNITTINQSFTVLATNGFELSGPIGLSNTVVITCLGNSLLRFSGNIAGPGGMTKAGTNSLVLSGANTYEGVTSIAGGAILANNTAGSATSTNSVTIFTDGTLSGNGIILGDVTVTSGGTLSPGSSVGPLVISNNLSLQSGSTTLIELNKSAGTNDSIAGASAVTYGGTLVVTNLAGALGAGDSFKLFAAASYGGTFDAIVLPTLPGALSWNTNNLAVDGTIRVVGGGPNFTAITASGGTLSIQGAGGNPLANYYVLTSTNIALPRGNWSPLVTNQFDSNGNFSFSDTIAPAVPRRFYAIQVP
jgi:fibronectin-binding autotransporter adhesin